MYLFPRVLYFTSGYTVICPYYLRAAPMHSFISLFNFFTYLSSIRACTFCYEMRVCKVRPAPTARRHLARVGGAARRGKAKRGRAKKVINLRDLCIDCISEKKTANNFMIMIQKS